jgi:hypothetical protein
MMYEYYSPGRNPAGNAPLFQNELSPCLRHQLSKMSLNAQKDSPFQFFFALHPNVFEKRARHFSEQGLHPVQPGAVRGRMNVDEPARPGGQIGLGFL